MVFFGSQAAMLLSHTLEFRLEAWNSCPVIFCATRPLPPKRIALRSFVRLDPFGIRKNRGCPTHLIMKFKVHL